jgi:glucose/arabinose dehydrogenase
MKSALPWFLVLTIALARTAEAAPNEVPVTALVSPEIRIGLSDLPAPYHSASARKGPARIDVPDDATLAVPEGFHVNVWAEGLQRPRFLVMTPDGDVLVVTSFSNTVWRLADKDGDGAAEVREVFANADNAANQPFGMAFADGHFYLANTDGLLRFAWQPGQTRIQGTGQKILELPGQGYNQHWTRNVVAAPDGEHLFVSVGSRSNVDEEFAPRATVMRARLDGSEADVFTSGLRNAVGMAFHPCTGDLYVTVNERDELGDDLVPDYLTRIQAGEFYGWPYAYLTPTNLDPRRMDGDVSEKPELAAQTKTPDVLFQAHSAALGLAFQTGGMFPAEWSSGAFVAMRGSWNRNEPTGYKVVFVPFDGQGRPTGSYRDFLTGFVQDPSGPTVWGRPVGLLFLADGSMLVTDDYNGRIYRVRY